MKEGVIKGDLECDKKSKDFWNDGVEVWDVEERRWKGSGRAVEGRWKGGGRAVEGRWKGGEGVVGRRWNVGCEVHTGKSCKRSWMIDFARN